MPSPPSDAPSTARLPPALMRGKLSSPQYTKFWLSLALRQVRPSDLPILVDGHWLRERQPELRVLRTRQLSTHQRWRQSGRTWRVRARRRHSARNSRPAWSKARPQCSRKFGKARLLAQRAPQLVLSFRSAVRSQGPRARRASPGRVPAPRRRRKRPPEEPQSQPQPGFVPHCRHRFAGSGPRHPEQAMGPARGLSLRCPSSSQKKGQFPRLEPCQGPWRLLRARSLEIAEYQGTIHSFSPPRQRRGARSSRPTHPHAPAARRSIRPPRRRQRRQFWANADEPVDVSFRVIQVGRDTYVSFAQANDNVLFPQELVKLGCFLAAPCREATVRPALCRI